MKPCPNSRDHVVREEILGPTCKYDYCETCEEDVEYLARNQGFAWNETVSQWARPEAPAPANNEAPATPDEDEDDEEMGGHPAAPAAPLGHRPVRNMGNGNHRIILHNDNQTGAHLVVEVLRRVFNKDLPECQYIMQDAHYNGQSTVFHCPTAADAQRFLDAVDVAKNDIRESDIMYAETVDHLRFTVQVA